MNDVNSNQDVFRTIFLRQISSLMCFETLGRLSSSIKWSQKIEEEEQPKCYSEQNSLSPSLTTNVNVEKYI